LSYVTGITQTYIILIISKWYLCKKGFI
jgi:hypothetical protein